MIKKIIFSMFLLCMLASKSYATPLDMEKCMKYIQKLSTMLGISMTRDQIENIFWEKKIETQEQFDEYVIISCNKYNIYTKKELYVYYNPDPKIYEFNEAIETDKLIWLYNKENKFICEIQKGKTQYAEYKYWYLDILCRKTPYLKSEEDKEKTEAFKAFFSKFI